MQKGWCKEAGNTWMSTQACDSTPAYSNLITTLAVDKKLHLCFPHISLYPNYPKIGPNFSK